MAFIIGICINLKAKAILYFTEKLLNNLSTYLKDYDNMLLPKDCNMTLEYTNLQHFVDSSNLDNFIHFSPRH